MFGERQAPTQSHAAGWPQVRCNATQRKELHDLATIFHGVICDVSLDTITLELQVCGLALPACLLTSQSPHTLASSAICDVASDHKVRTSLAWSFVDHICCSVVSQGHGSFRSCLMGLAGTVCVRRVRRPR